HPRALSQRLYAVRRDGLAALTYVDDLAGGLRGVRLSHAARTYQATAVAMLGQLTDADLAYLALPLRTAYAQSLLGVQLACGFPIALEGRPDRAVESVALVRPTFIAATPGLLDRIRAAIEEEHRPGLLRRQRTVDKLVRTDVRELFGDRLRFVLCGGGALDTELLEFFEGAGVTVLEAYGRAEAGGAVSIALPEDAGSRTAGRPLPGTDVRISGDGEIQVASPGVMDGYHERRGDSEAVLDQGWLSTGDAGVLDEEGRVRVLGGYVARRGE
ncbi:MAG TPA: AMP-binding protein, partial [Nocardioides sp.]|nr:AMP-binding protein [Nocardioides sp.]